MGRAGGSRGLLFLQLLLLAGELVCHGSILQLHARQRVLDVRQAGGLGSLELQCCRGRGLGAQLGTQRGLVLVCHLGIEAVAPLLQQVGLVFLHAATHYLVTSDELMHLIRYSRSAHLSRVQRVGVFNFGTDRVRVLEKTSGSGSGTDRVRVLAPHFLSIGYYRVLKILIGYFSVTSRIRYFLLV